MTPEKIADLIRAGSFKTMALEGAKNKIARLEAELREAREKLKAVTLPAMEQRFSEMETALTTERARLEEAEEERHKAETDFCGLHTEVRAVRDDVRATAAVWGINPPDEPQAYLDEITVDLTRAAGEEKQ